MNTQSIDRLPGNPNLPPGVSQSDIDDPDYPESDQPTFTARQTAGYREYVREMGRQLAGVPSPVIPCGAA